MLLTFWLLPRNFLWRCLWRQFSGRHQLRRTIQMRIPLPMISRISIRTWVVSFVKGLLLKFLLKFLLELCAILLWVVFHQEIWVFVSRTKMYETNYLRSLSAQVSRRNGACTLWMTIYLWFECFWRNLDDSDMSFTALTSFVGSDMISFFIFWRF